MESFCLSILVLLLASFAASVSAFDWKDGNGGVKWSMDCDFYGSDIGKIDGPGEKCGGNCVSNSQCTHFTWFSGTCYLKRFSSPATASALGGGVCGWVNRDSPSPSPQPGPGGSGTTTRYWDCCKVSCSWPGKGPSRPVNTCSNDGTSLRGSNDQSGCGGGPSFVCNNQQPWAVNDNLAYGFAAFNGIAGQGSPCCKCYQLDFTSGPVAGKKMIVQIINSGDDLGPYHFDLQIPGGGVGIFNGCSNQWNAPSNGWGERYGGVGSIGECNQLPGQLQDGCKWRFNWFNGANNPNVDFRQVNCPSELVQRTGCTA